MKARVTAVLDRDKVVRGNSPGPSDPPFPPDLSTAALPPALQTAADQQVGPAGKKRGRYQKRQKAPENDLFTGGMPTNGIDLMALWELPQSAFTGARIKITRKKYASLEQELIDEGDIASYNMQNIARQYGQGDYYLYLSSAPNGLWKHRQTKISVSAQYAAAAGYQDYPVQTQPTMLPRISEARALQATADAMGASRPITVGDLASLMEMMADKTAAAITRSMPPPAPPAPPMAIEGMLMLWKTLMEVQNQSEERTLKLASRFMNSKIPDPEEAEEPGVMEGIIKALPQLLQLFVPQVQPNQAHQAGQAAPVQEPAPAKVNGTERPMPENANKAKVEEPAMTTDPNVPLNDAERKQFTAAVFMLKPFVGLILEAMQSGKSMKEVGEELADYIPGALEPQMLELAKLCRERGPRVLGIISPDLETDEAAEVVYVIAEVIKLTSIEMNEDKS